MPDAFTILLLWLRLNGCTQYRDYGCYDYGDYGCDYNLSVAVAYNFMDEFNLPSPVAYRDAARLLGPMLAMKNNNKSSHSLVIIPRQLTPF